MILGIVVGLISLVLWRGLLFGQVPIPLDALVGVYHPWADHFWGFVAGVPYKNIALTDVFSQLYPWRSAVVDAWSSLSFPLWNPYSFSGYPLAATWQSAPFFPLNVLMVIFGKVTGYGILASLQPLLGMIFMAVYLRELKLGRAASLVGAVSFAFGGYMMTYLTWATTGYILAFIPAGLFLIERFFTTHKIRYLTFLSFCVFFILTGGFFQPAFFALLIISTYALISGIAVRKVQLVGLIAGSLLIGIGLAAIQLVPTLELLSLSIREIDHNISEYKYGLLPLKSLVTFVAPDFFGNPATGNYFGPIQYQEASGYFGVVGLILAVCGALFHKRNFRTLFFTFWFIISLLLVIDGPIGGGVFSLKIPLISTGYASRWLMVTSLSGAVLAAFGFAVVKRSKAIVALVTLGLLVALLFVTRGESTGVSFRNLILPTAVVGAGLVLFLLPRKSFVLGAICLLVIFDMVRYTTKFTPMVDSKYGTTQIPFIAQIKELAGIDRVAIDQGPLMPANTWMYGGIQTIGGYDPLLYRDYGVWFRALNVGLNPNQKIDGSLGQGSMTRYLNLDNPYSPMLDLAGVKYFLTLKKDKEGRFKPDGEINGELLKKYKPVLEYGASVLLENTTPFPRVSLIYEAESEMNSVMAAEKLIAGFDFRNKLLLEKTEPAQYEKGMNDEVVVIAYEPNVVRLKVRAENGGYLLLTDTDYPGWKAKVSEVNAEIIRADGIFRAIELPPGESTVRFFYFPDSFRNALFVSGGSLLVLVLLSIYFRAKKF